MQLQGRVPHTSCPRRTAHVCPCRAVQQCYVIPLGACTPPERGGVRASFFSSISVSQKRNSSRAINTKPVLLAKQVSTMSAIRSWESMLEKHHPCVACFHLSPRHCFGHQGETGCWAQPLRLPTCSLTFAAPGCQQSWCLPKIIWDLNISSKDDDCFDHIQVVMLGDKRKLRQELLHDLSLLPSPLH